jgi:glycosyltransferase involved in cell wall biosynthesis
VGGGGSAPDVDGQRTWSNDGRADDATRLAADETPGSPGGSPLKILMVAEDFPWPPLGGGAVRLVKVVEALTSLGELDLFTLHDQRRSLLDLPQSVTLRRLKIVDYPRSAAQWRWRTSWFLRRGVPLEVETRRRDTTPRRALMSWVDDDYDLVWFSTAALFHWMGSPRLGPTIVDFIDLEDEKELRRARILKSDRTSSGRGRVGHVLATARAYVNARDWRRFQRSIASTADRIVLCSHLEVDKSGFTNAVDVVTAFQRPVQAAGHQELGDPPVLLFQGELTYAPNIDAARWLVNSIAPLVHSKLPNAEIRLVGSPSQSVKLLHRPPAVTVIGRVPDMIPELARADVAVVPIRYGGGIRNKILESFAHRIPVVSTTIGAEGIDAEHGIHLLLADTPEDFAAACERVLTDIDLRKRLVDAAEQRYLETYEWAPIRERIRTICEEVVASRRA